MPGPKGLFSALCTHISGQFVCEINRTTYYLGPADSPESIAKYAVLIREYRYNDLKVLSWVTSETLKGLAASILPKPEKGKPVRSPYSAQA
jgi:hypothetical protein